MKEDTTKINVTLPTNLVEKIKENNYNRNKLIVSLLKKHIENKQK
jgi:metal-responsive CopG/Arc/MetJ family transcriptional regulator